MGAGKGLRTGDLVTVPAGDGRREAVVESVRADGLRFTDTRGSAWPARGAELVPLAVTAGFAVTRPAEVARTA